MDSELTKCFISFAPKSPNSPHIDCLQFGNTGGICKNAYFQSQNGFPNKVAAYT